jgi:hypothetical protein
VSVCNSTTKVPALAPVQNAELPVIESLTTIVSCFSTELSTVVLKTFWALRSLLRSLKEKSRHKGGFQILHRAV